MPSESGRQPIKRTSTLYRNALNVFYIEMFVVLICCIVAPVSRWRLCVALMLLGEVGLAVTVTVAFNRRKSSAISNVSKNDRVSAPKNKRPGAPFLTHRFSQTSSTIEVGPKGPGRPYGDTARSFRSMEDPSS